MKPIDPRMAALLSMLHKYRALTMGTIWPVAVLRMQTKVKPTGNTIASLEGRGYVRWVPVIVDGQSVTTVLILTPEGATLAAQLEPEGEIATNGPVSGLRCRTRPKVVA